MTTEQAKAVLQTKQGQLANDSAFLDLVSELLTNGWQADEDRITSGIQSGIADAVAAATATLTDQIAALTEQVAALTPAPAEDPALPS